MFEDADANASARIILLPVETVADILIIEDDPSINEVVCAHLERRGYRCRQAFSGTEGLLLLREQRPDVVMQGRDCTNSEAALFILGGVLQHKLALQPGEEREIHVIYGICASRKEARRDVEMYTESGGRLRTRWRTILKKSVRCLSKRRMKRSTTS